jgi:hypothetical protein
VYNDKPEIRQLALTNDEPAAVALSAEGPGSVNVSENFAGAGATAHSILHSNAAAGIAGEEINISSRLHAEKLRNPIYKYRKSNESVKAEGLNDIFEIADKAGTDTFDDRELAALVNEFPEGIVIADFFVPNMCKSSCMAMNFIVMGDKEPPPGEVNVRLDLKLREYCEDDDTDYEIKIAPDGGELKIDNVAVPLDQRFNPSAFNVGVQASKEIVITYSVGADVKNINVTVFKKPEVRIAIDNQDDANKVVTFKNNTKFADRYEWNFGNGQFSTQENPGPVNFGNVSTATVLLKAGNGPCENQSEPLPIVFKNIPGEDRSCTPLDGIAEKFRVLNDVASAEFKKAIEQYEILANIFIKKLESLLNLTNKEQFNLLIQDLSVSVIQKLIRTLNSIIVAKPEQRNSALMLYEVLLKLVMFYACCQDQDIDKAKVKTANTLNIMSGLLDSWKVQIGFKDNEQLILKSMLEATQKERDKTVAETPQKKMYIEILTKMAECIEKLLA